MEAGFLLQTVWHGEDLQTLRYGNSGCEDIMFRLILGAKEVGDSGDPVGAARRRISRLFLGQG